MDFLTGTLWLAGVFVIGLIGWYSYKYFVSRSAGKVIRIFLFEMVGKDKVFRGERKGFERSDDILGVFLTIGKSKIPISSVSHEDFFPDRKFGKCLMVCKFADDDYRPLTLLKGDNWFRKELVSKPMLDKKGGEVFESLEVNGELVEKPVFERVEELVQVVEPLGVSQKDREAMRFNRAHARRMRELRGDKAGWWDKYGSYVMSAATLMIMFMLVVYVTNKNNESVKYITDKWSDEADKLTQTIKSPLWAENILSQVEAGKLIGGNPPS